MINKEIIPFICRKIKEHEKTIDPNSPRDYLDFLIIAAEDNDEMGFYAIAMTIWSLYIAGSDTVAKTLRWLCLVLTVFPTIQVKGYFDADNRLNPYWQHFENITERASRKQNPRPFGKVVRKFSSIFCFSESRSAIFPKITGR